MKLTLAVPFLALFSTMKASSNFRILQEIVASDPAPTDVAPISILAPTEVLLPEPVDSEPPISILVPAENSPAPVSAKDTTPPSFNNIRLEGLGKLVQDLVLASNSSDSIFDVLELNVLDESGTDAGMAYQGEIVLTNTQNVSVTGLFNGLYDPIDNKIALYASEIEASDDDNDANHPNDHSDRDDGYTELPPTATNDNGVIQDALAYGIKAVVETGLSQNKIPAASPDYILTTLNSVGYKANGEKGIWIRFIISLENSLTYKVDSNITVYYKNSDSSYKLSYYKYKSYNWPDSAFPSADNSNNNHNVPVTPAPAVPRADGYTDLPLTAVNDNGVFKDALAYGIKAVVETGISQNKIPAASPDYTLSSLSSVGYKTNGDVGIWVRFIVSVQNSLNYKVDSNITVFYRNSNSSYKLSYYNYKSSNFPNSALNAGSSNNSSANTTAPVVNNQTQPSYTALSWDEVAQNQQIHGALDYGIYTVVQKGITLNKIPAASPDYIITQNSTASYLASAKGVTYKFQVSLKNALNYKVDLSVTVFFRNSDVSYSVNGYSLASSGYPASALATSSPSTTSVPIATTVSAPVTNGNN